MLIVTGVLVVSIMVTFLGSTVRLFQTVGWMPIHSITWLHIPSWMGLWLGLYPSWEGLLIPPLGLAYVAGAWLWTKWQAHRNDNDRTGTGGGSKGADNATTHKLAPFPEPAALDPKPVLVKSS